MDFCFLFPFLLAIGAALLGTALGWMLRKKKITGLENELVLHQQEHRSISEQFQSTTGEHHALQQKYSKLDQSFEERQLAFEDLERNYKSMQLAFDQSKSETETQRIEASTRLSGLENDLNRSQDECLEQQTKIVEMEEVLGNLKQEKTQLVTSKENLSQALADT